MKTKIKVIWLAVILLFVCLAAYFIVFGRALRQSENHFGIFLALPKATFSSAAVRIDDKKYLARNATAFIKTIEAQGFSFVDQMGAGYFFDLNGVKYVSTSRMYSSYFMTFTVPAVAGRPVADSASTEQTIQTIAVNAEWLKIIQAINDCQAVSIMQAHSRAVSADLKDGRRLEAVEPELDNIMRAALDAEKKCGRIIMATE